MQRIIYVTARALTYRNSEGRKFKVLPQNIIDDSFSDLNVEYMQIGESVKGRYLLRLILDEVDATALNESENELEAGLMGYRKKTPAEAAALATELTGETWAVSGNRLSFTRGDGNTVEI